MKTAESRTSTPIFEDDAGTIWVAGLGGGVGYFEDGVFRRVAAEGTTLVQAVTRDEDGNVWIGQINYGGCVLRDLTCNDDDRFLRSRSIRALFLDSAGAMWAGTDRGAHRYHDGAWTEFTMEDGLPHDLVRVFLETRDGAIWLGTNGGGIARITDEGVEALSESDGLSSNRVRALHESSPGVIWVGTEDGGLNRVSLADPAAPLHTAEIRVVDRSLGLFDDGIHSIVDDGRGRLWMNTNRGDLLDPARGARATRFARPIDLVRAKRRTREPRGQRWCPLRRRPGLRRSAVVRDAVRCRHRRSASIEPADHELPVLIEDLRVEGGRSISLAGATDEPHVLQPPASATSASTTRP